MGPVRPVAGRLTGGWEHARYPTLPTPQDTESEPTSSALRALAIAGGERGPAELHADRGLRKLLAGKRGEAVRHLESALALSPRDPRVLSDLAAAYEARGGAQERPHDLFLALAAAEEAVALAPRLLEARFNRALLLSRLHMPWAAAPAWRDYLARDPESPWADEARAHLGRLSGPAEAERWQRARPLLERAAAGGDAAAVERLAGRFRLRARRWTEEELLARWAEGRRAGRPDEAARALRAAGAGRVVVAVLARA